MMNWCTSAVMYGREIYLEIRFRNASFEKRKPVNEKCRDSTSDCRLNAGRTHQEMRPPVHSVDLLQLW
jgi:hypothetical protein